MLTETQLFPFHASGTRYGEMGDPLKVDHRAQRGERNLAILIVEDEPGLRMLLEKSLQKHNQRVISVGNGFEALSIFANQQIDLVIMDVMMPIMDGFETCSELRKLSNVPIVMLSGLGSAKTEADALQCGVNVFLRKPVSLTTLRLCVQSLLNEHNLITTFPI